MFYHFLELQSLIIVEFVESFIDQEYFLKDKVILHIFLVLRRSGANTNNVPILIFKDF